mmetsp:Transcript_6110/g.11174  ORF Transcript_6110/g.11174 Transcript_6110/m.11174 type:complete len:99 (+) Transcript_6110:545-841(+)
MEGPVSEPRSAGRSAGDGGTGGGEASPTRRSLRRNQGPFAAIRRAGTGGRLRDGNGTGRLARDHVARTGQEVSGRDVGEARSRRVAFGRGDGQGASRV